MINILPTPDKLVIGNNFYVKNPPIYELKKDIVEEGYRIEIGEKGTIISYSSDSGRYYADVTMQQIYKEFGEELMELTIEDSPKYKYRGFLCDVSRHFFTINELKKQLEVMAMLKFNKFHFHLTDDQGWRIEIKKYPLLNSIGSVREGTRGNKKPYNGFYTQEEIKELVKWCDERFIEVIPEIDMPGHFTSVIASYPNLGCENKQIPVSQNWGVHDNLACAGNEETYDFCRNVLKEIFDLFPSKYIHLGGDEALKTKWCNCKKCQEVIKDNNLENEESLQGYFTNKMVEFCKENGKIVINWNDGFLAHNLDNDIIMQYWKQDKKYKEAMYSEAKDGRKIIFSPFSSYYFDYPYGMTSLQKTYECEIPKELESNIIGLEATLWTEYINNVQKLEQMVYPRILAVAERAWSKKKLSYPEFEIVLKNYLPVLEENSISYENNYNPSFIKGKLQVIKFVQNVICWDIIIKSCKYLLKTIKKPKKRK
ncbi:MAG: beta-N-acetylhexosaminidase [Clostridia bacterium]